MASGQRPEVEVGELLARTGLTLAVAESCTGGLLGGRLTDVPGSSSYFVGGVIAYADSLKTGLLGVPADLISEHGAVSAECALSMAAGARRATGADVAVAITGIAGPTGARPGKPVGTTYIALVAPDLERVEHHCWPGNRARNRQAAVDAALAMLADYLAGRTGIAAGSAVPAASR